MAALSVRVELACSHVLDHALTQRNRRRHGASASDRESRTLTVGLTHEVSILPGVGRHLGSRPLGIGGDGERGLGRRLHQQAAIRIRAITGLLADLPPEQTHPTAVATAHADILDSEFKYQWFEAGEALEDLLYPVKGSKQRIAKLMKAYLPERRLFWTRQCAISALAMRGDEKARHSPWKQLALVGRDIASDLPLDQIPLMKQVAEISVRAFERRA